ncbi:hypothetical protein PtB15_11B277 [Puccinia triticina]|nr:hypothetical protein PtB15_11B277 [Puccinia triticina]
MQHIYNSYKFLAKQEQDFVLFTLAINDYGIEESAECWKDGPITKPFSKPMIELIYFMRKVRRFIKDALEDEGPGELERKAFFLEVKDDLMEMRRFYFDPRVPPGHDREEFIKVFHFRAAALRFIHQRIGADYINEPEFEEYKEDTAGFDARFQLYYLLQAHSEWRYILLYYAHYASNAMTRGKSAEVPARVRREIGTVLWGRIAETAAAYRKLKTAQSKRLEEISAHITYRDIVEKHDRMVKDLPTLKHTFDSLVDGP